MVLWGYVLIWYVRRDGTAAFAQKSDSVINVKVPLDAIAERAKKYQPKPKITYKIVQDYVEKKYGFKVPAA